MISKIKYYILTKIISNFDKLFENKLRFFSESEIRKLINDSKHLFSEQGVHDSWMDFERKILNAFVSDPENFLRAEIVANTLHPAQNFLSSKLIKELIKSPHAPFYLSLLPESPVCNPLRDHATYYSSPLLIQHIHHLMKIEEFFGSIHNFERIIEIGGGYGGFSRVIKKTEFKGDYVVFDLSVMQRIQDLYLRKVFGYLEDLSLINSIKRYTKPGELYDHVIATPMRTLLVATWSLSEMPLKTRDEILKIIPGVNQGFIAFQSDFYEMDNVSYFREKFQESSKVSIFPQEHYSSNFYMIIDNEAGH